MLNKLKEKWGVNTLNLCLIITTFALGGRLCAFLGSILLNLVKIDKSQGLIFWVLYIIAMTILWPLSVISVSILTGQFRFFQNYLKKIFKKFTGK